MGVEELGTLDQRYVARKQIELELELCKLIGQRPTGAKTPIDMQDIRDITKVMFSCYGAIGLAALRKNFQARSAPARAFQQGLVALDRYAHNAKYMVEQCLVQREGRSLKSMQTAKEEKDRCTFNDMYSQYDWHRNGWSAVCDAWHAGNADVVALLQPYKKTYLKPTSMIRALIDEASNGIFTSERSGSTSAQQPLKRRVSSTFDTMCTPAAATVAFIEIMSWMPAFLMGPGVFYK